MSRKQKKKKKQAKQAENKLYIGIYEKDYTLEDTQGCDGDYSGFIHTNQDWEVTGIWVDEDPARAACNWCPDYLQNTLGFKNGDEIYLLTVRYSTGDTFGRADGQGKVLAATRTEKDIRQIRDLCRDFDRKKNATWCIKVSDKLAERICLEYIDERSGPIVYAVWDGYFECLEGFHVYRMTVGNKRDGEVYL